MRVPGLGRNTSERRGTVGDLRSDELARKYGIAEAMVGNALRRQERRGLVEHVSRRLYVNKLAGQIFPT